MVNNFSGTLTEVVEAKNFHLGDHSTERLKGSEIHDQISTLMIREALETTIEDINTADQAQ